MVNESKASRKMKKLNNNSNNNNNNNSTSAVTNASLSNTSDLNGSIVGTPPAPTIMNGMSNDGKSSKAKRKNEKKRNSNSATSNDPNEDELSLNENEMNESPGSSSLASNSASSGAIEPDNEDDDELVNNLITNTNPIDNSTTTTTNTTSYSNNNNNNNNSKFKSKPTTMTTTNTTTSSSSSSNNTTSNQAYPTSPPHLERLNEIDLNAASDISDESASNSLEHQIFFKQSNTLKQQQQQQQSSNTKLASNNYISKSNSNYSMQNNRNLSTTTTTTTTTNENFNLANNINKQLQPQPQPQMLDGDTLRNIIDQTKCHLILDENEKLQVNSSEEFVSLFKTSTSTSNLLGSLSDETSSAIKSSPVFSTAMNGAGPTIPDDKFVKCVSIFGNTGDGKSHTLNHTFFNGRNIFSTSNKQETCTIGVWCAYDPITRSLIFDTEGLLGATENENKRMRLLLKVLAISDVVIYRTRAERLHNDLFKFLSDASIAYTKYFSKELKGVASKLNLNSISQLGPRCIIFHETMHTDVLSDGLDIDGVYRTATQRINERFAKLEQPYDAFNLIDYVGTRTSTMGLSSTPQTDFTKLAQCVRQHLDDHSYRPPRKLSSIYQVLKALNEKFSGDIVKNQLVSFADEYFTCSAVCLSCRKRCQCSINHIRDGVEHSCNDKCVYDHQFDNKVYVCKLCHQSGKEQIVIPKTAASNENSLVGIVKYALSGYVLECPHHGIIYRSRQYWYGNQDPESVVRTELKHIWSGQVNFVGTSHNLSRKIIDGVSYLGESLHSVSAKPTKMAMQWMADKVAPTYWTPNSEIVKCYSCSKEFDILEKKHHCRGCGKGFCDKCTLKRMIIPWWSLSDPVRVCDACYEKKDIPEPICITQSNSMSNGFYGSEARYGSAGMGMGNTNANSNVNRNSISNVNSNSNTSLAALGIQGNNDVIARKVTETVQDTIGYIGYATKIPFDVIKETARPSYWKPDSECLQCAICEKEFDDLLPLHHCRSCGNGVCNKCSPHLRQVPSRGWDTPVRVCNNCVQNELPAPTSSSFK